MRPYFEKMVPLGKELKEKELKEQKAKYLWMSLPVADEFIISYNVEVDEDAFNVKIHAEGEDENGTEHEADMDLELC